MRQTDDNADKCSSVKVAPTAVTPNNLKYLLIGDSNTNIAFADLLRNTLRARGHNPHLWALLQGRDLICQIQVGRLVKVAQAGHQPTLPIASPPEIQLLLVVKLPTKQ